MHSTTTNFDMDNLTPDSTDRPIGGVRSQDRQDWALAELLEALKKFRQGLIPNPLPIPTDSPPIHKEILTGTLTEHKTVMDMPF